MAFDQYIVDRIIQVLSDKKVIFMDKKMIGGMCFLVDDKMLCGTHIDKKSGDSLLMARIGEEAYEKNIHKKGCLPMDFTGRPMKGYVFVNSEGIDTDEQLEYWIDLCLVFNPLAKASKSKKK